MFYKTYLKTRLARIEYLSKIKELLYADIYLAISKTVANDLTVHLGIDKSRIVNIDGGPIEHSQNQAKMDIPKPFILMPTGNDYRKNNKRGVLGFNEFNKLHNNEYALVITSFFNEREKTQLANLAHNVFFTGNIDGSKLMYLYKEATAVLFPSEYEGLGLPILEAIQSQKPVACSNISVFQEISNTAFWYFEPSSIGGIGNALESAVTLGKLDLDTYEKILKKYKWENTAALVAEVAARPKEKKLARNGQRLAVFGPNPASLSDQEKIIQDCHGELSRLIQIDYFTPSSDAQEARRINYLPFIAPTNMLTSGLGFNSPNYQNTLYHIYNTPDCAEVLLAALASPGILVLYDLELDNLWKAARRKKLISSGRYELELKINEQLNIESISMLSSLIASQKTVIVYTKRHKQALEKLAMVLGVKIQLLQNALPIAELAYPEALPYKVTTIGSVEKSGVLKSDNKRVSITTDSQNNEALSKMKIVLFRENCSLYDILSALRFGIIPCVPDSDSFDELPDSICIKYHNSEEVVAVAEKLLQDRVAHKSMMDNIAHYLENHAQKKSAHEIVRIAGGG